MQRVQTQLNDSISLIDDLDETLAIFDLKLRHMREDIAAIESRNNRCISATHIPHSVAVLKITSSSCLCILSRNFVSCVSACQLQQRDNVQQLL